MGLDGYDEVVMWQLGLPLIVQIGVCKTTNPGQESPTDFSEFIERGIVLGFGFKKKRKTHVYSILYSFPQVSGFHVRLAQILKALSAVLHRSFQKHVQRLNWDSHLVIRAR